jgi:hypothetical protein
MLGHLDNTRRIISRYFYSLPTPSMIAEPYICIKGANIGTIEWSGTSWFNRMDQHTTTARGEEWQPYADVEREKLKGLTQEARDQKKKGLRYYSQTLIDKQMRETGLEPARCCHH